MQQCCSAKSFNFHLRFKVFVNKINHLLQTNEQCQYLLKNYLPYFQYINIKREIGTAEDTSSDWVLTNIQT